MLMAISHQTELLYVVLENKLSYIEDRGQTGRLTVLASHDPNPRP